MPDEYGLTEFEVKQDIYAIRADFERMWLRWAQRVHHRTGNASYLLELKEFQKTCPNLPPIRPD